MNHDTHSKSIPSKLYFVAKSVMVLTKAERFWGVARAVE